MEQNFKKAYIYTLLVVLFWSTSASAFKISLGYLSVSRLLLFSTFFSSLIFITLIIVKKKFYLLRKLTGKDLVKSIYLGFFNPFLYYIILFYAYDLLPAQQAQPLNLTWGIVLVLLSVPLLKQKVKLRDIFCLVISFAGVLVIAARGDLLNLKFTSNTGVILALSTSVIWAVYWLLNTADKSDPLIRLFLNFFFGFLYIAIFTQIKEGIALPDIRGIIGTCWIGTFEFGITYILWMNALKLIDKTIKITILIYSIPFISFIFISIFVKEKILFASIAGAALIVAGILLNKIDEFRNSR